MFEWQLYASVNETFPHLFCFKCQPYKLLSFYAVWKAELLSY